MSINEKIRRMRDIVAGESPQNAWRQDTPALSRNTTSSDAIEWAEVIEAISYADPPSAGVDSYKLRLVTDTTEAWVSGDDYTLTVSVLGTDDKKYTCILSAGSGTYSPTSETGSTYWAAEAEITVSKAVGYQGHSDTDLRNYDNWFQVGAIVPVAQIGSDESEWYIILGQQYCGSSTDSSMRWIEADKRIAAVWK